MDGNGRKGEGGREDIFTKHVAPLVLVQFIVTNAAANVPLIFYEYGGLEQGRGIEIQAPL